MTLFLALTADERGWALDKPMIFLDRSCVNFDQLDLVASLNTKFASPYGITSKEKDRDFEKLNILIDTATPTLFSILNTYHCENNSNRHWQILLGHWLHRTVATLINRYSSLAQCLQNYDVSHTAVVLDESYPITPQNSLEAIWNFSDSAWNNQIYSLILEECFSSQIFAEKRYVNDEQTADSKVNKEAGQPKGRFFLKSLAKKLQSNWLVKKIIKKSDICFAKTYLGHWEEFFIAFRFVSLPVYSAPETPTYHSVNSRLRLTLSELFIEGVDDPVERMIRKLIIRLLPVCYLEGYDDLARAAENAIMPTNPKLIFTSNRFDNDDIFKFYICAQIKKQALYLVGQHGSNYGTHRYLSNPSIEEKTSDIFLTWGWDGDFPQHQASGIFLQAKRPIRAKRKPTKSICLLQLHFPHLHETWDTAYEYEKYFEDQLSFISSLNAEFKQKLIVRLHPNHAQHNWQDKNRWEKFEPSIKIDDSFYFDILRESSGLKVFSYDSAGFLIGLSYNTPTIAFWQNGLGHLRQEAVEDYRQLVDAGIVHLSPLSAANHINENFDDFDKWWFSDRTQNARKAFTAKYAVWIPNRKTFFVKKIKEQLIGKR